jgi:hypothetical protein
MHKARRAKSIIFSFPFYGKKRDVEEELKRMDTIVRISSRLSFIKRVWLETDRLREPLYVEVDAQNDKINGLTVFQVEERLETLLERIYNVKECF